ncbi:MAG: AMP-binding protein, partial [Arenicellales bacterium]|nr:AMP-binding protein [Arenicellales bacterium]
MEQSTPAWVAHYPQSIDWQAPLERQPLYQTLEQTASNYRDHPAIDFLGRKLNYGELFEQVNHAAKGLQLLGVKPGTRIGLCLPNTPYSVICYYAALCVGATVVNYNPLYVERELAFQVDDSGTEIMVTMDLEALYPKVAAMLSRTESLKKIVVCKMAAVLPSVKGVLFSVLKRKDIASIEKSDAVVR